MTLEDVAARNMSQETNVTHVKWDTQDIQIVTLVPFSTLDFTFPLVARLVSAMKLEVKAQFVT